MLLISTKQCPGCFTFSASTNRKKNLLVRCYQYSYFIAEKTEAKGINDVTSKGKMISGECIYRHNKIYRKGHDNVDSEQNKVDE